MVLNRLSDLEFAYISHHLFVSDTDMLPDEVYLLILEFIPRNILAHWMLTTPPSSRLHQLLLDQSLPHHTSVVIVNASQQCRFNDRIIKEFSLAVVLPASEMLGNLVTFQHHNLRKLSLSGTLVTNSEMELFAYCPNLLQLNLRNYFGIKSEHWFDLEGVQTVMTKCKRLKVLDVSWSCYANKQRREDKRVTAENLLNGLKGSPSLRWVDVRWCKRAGYVPGLEKHDVPNASGLMIEILC